MINILLGKLLFERFDEIFMFQVFSDILIDGFNELIVRRFHHLGNLLSYESFEEFDDFLVFDVEPYIFGVDILQNRCEECFVEGFEERDIRIDVLDVGLVRQVEFLFSGSHVFCCVFVEENILSVLIEESSVIQQRIILLVKLVVYLAHLLDDGFSE